MNCVSVCLGVRKGTIKMEFIGPAPMGKCDSGKRLQWLKHPCFVLISDHCYYFC